MGLARVVKGTSKDHGSVTFQWVNISGPAKRLVHRCWSIRSVKDNTSSETRTARISIHMRLSNSSLYL